MNGGMNVFGRKKTAGNKAGFKTQVKQNEAWYADQEDGTIRLCGGQEEIQVGVASVTGTRKTQQDTVLGYRAKDRALAIICDGMGGLSGGETASRIAADSIAGAWFDQQDLLDIPEFFRREAINADRKVFAQTDASGQPLRAGTTVAAVIIRAGQLYWLSVGDSRIWLIRGNEILTLNVEHNYRMILNARLRRGELTPEQYAAQEHRAEALISYIGMGNVSLMDINAQAYPLCDGDTILVCSDGLYRSLYEEEILAVIKRNRQDMQKAADAFMAAVAGRKKQDNTSVALLRYRGAGYRG